MKALFKNIILFSLLVVLYASCKKEENRIVAKSNAISSVLTASRTSIVLDAADANNEAVTFSFSPTDFGYSAAVSYALEFGKKDSNFVNGKIVDLGNSLETKLTVAALNGIANQIRLKGFEANEVEVRVKAEIGSGAAPAHSNIVRINMTPY